MIISFHYFIFIHPKIQWVLLKVSKASMGKHGKFRMSYLNITNKIYQLNVQLIPIK